MLLDYFADTLRHACRFAAAIFRYALPPLRFAIISPCRAFIIFAMLDIIFRRCCRWRRHATPLMFHAMARHIDATLLLFALILRCFSPDAAAFFATFFFALSPYAVFTFHAAADTISLIAFAR